MAVPIVQAWSAVWIPADLIKERIHLHEWATLLTQVLALKRGVFNLPSVVFQVANQTARPLTILPRVSRNITKVIKRNTRPELWEGLEFCPLRGLITSILPLHSWIATAAPWTSLGFSHTISEPGPGKLFLKGPDGKYFRTVGYMVSVETTQLSHSAKQRVHKWMDVIIFQWNFIYKNRQPVCRLWFVNLLSKGTSVNQGPHWASGFCLGATVGDNISPRGIATTFSCKAKMLLGPGWLHSWIYHFHVTNKAWCALPTLLVVQSKLTHLTMGMSESKDPHESGIPCW